MAAVVSELKICNGLAVAARPLAAGQVVLREAPLVTGPGRAGKPVCLTCYSTVDAEFYCSHCGWQLCGSQCEEAGPHRLECSHLKEKGVECLWEDVEEDTFCMDFLGAFRLLLTLQDKPQLRKELLERDMQTERRQEKYNSRYYVNCEQAIMKYIRDTCGMSSFTDQEILNALGLMEMYGTPLLNGAKALYSSWLLLAHCCIPNTYSTVNTDGSITVRASLAIKEGEPLTRCLVDPLWCSQARRRQLDRTFLIDCTCHRCADPSELGTCLNGLHSEDYGDAVFLPSKPLQEGGGPWLSPSLPGIQLPGPASSQKLEQLTRKCDEGLAEMGGSTMGLEFVLNTRGEWDVLPKSGQVMLGVKHRLVMAWQDQGLEVEKLKTKVEYCRELLAVLARVHPGRNYTSVMLHFQAAAAAGALADKDDSSMAAEGAEHAAAAAAMCEGEEGNMYQQLREFVLALAEQLTA